MPDSNPSGWIEAAVGGLGLTSTALGAWILKTTTRQARIEQKLDDFQEHADMRMDKMEKGIGKIGKHITGVDLW